MIVVNQVNHYDYVVNQVNHYDHVRIADICYLRNLCLPSEGKNGIHFNHVKLVEICYSMIVPFPA